MADESNPLREAINKITDWPTGAGGAQPGSSVANLGTSAILENVIPDAVPDPISTELANLKASNAELAAQIAGPATAAAPTMYHGVYSSGPTLQSYAIGSQADPNQLVGITMENINDPWTQEAISGLISQTNSAAGKTGWQNLQSNPEGILSSRTYNPTFATTPPSSTSTSKASRAPVNPGPQAPWQKSQQYWKDLAVFNAGK